MLTRKQLKLVTGTETREETVIKADRLQQHQRGLEVIETAERQAEDLLAEAESRARVEAGRTVHQAEARFLRQADDILRGWQQERALMEAFVAEQAGQVLSDAMRQLVQEIPDEQRTSALLRQLLRNQSGEGRGVLYCHPEQQPQVEIWLNDHAHLGWQLAIDDVLDKDELQLMTPQGVMNLSWRRAVEQLVPAPASTP
ncbi:MULTISPECIES: type III secretion system stator protein SctL [Lonsdalea]|uniref:Serine kinase n=2 Tax=Lonsdalea TaxID=1082702 RepID=A0ACD1JG13_9GAMM|nr:MULTISPECIES: type III secretion system stator protein SctL [Lonsdalea]OSN02629.1 serine kinase [Lonsdalea populi]QPQ25613.1 type III secretion system stator protein SctL [Lonsdalea populi]RAT16105.1 serine kinase [Lonsdalea quercina]RAT18138.1 serine kinase [Lonsdalea quercina]RAT21294.1 serine kinase [Lonsdalea populi]